MSAVDQLVRVELEVTCRVRGTVDTERLASMLAGQLSTSPFHLGNAVVFPTAIATPARSSPRARRGRPPAEPRTARGASR